MLRRILLVAAVAVGLWGASPSAQAQEPYGVPYAAPAYSPQAYGAQWGHSYNTQDWERFYHYPYVYYPQNYYGPDYYRSAESLYFRYPEEMRIPVYNRSWQNEYPQARRYYQGHHFILDTF
ncbi:MAG TPA: calmodulin-binding protein [Pirellulales bacterium]|nr:calmodulin-binding protein [Pirellulales bacterium]